eukprot:TRINITY_DN25980_c0_g1_i1.p1 TRINITY_DN25980_c0_g1~~TRINITY_DN25980_c0_g1_i1.p1  ORF type:complete len:667 (+),score=224.43 TRINITY_DN25980_c0_g1_i1:104-2104(+)
MPSADAAQQWLSEHGVADLFERGVQALVAAKPANTALFLSQFYAAEAAKSRGTTSASVSPSHRRASSKMAIQVPDDTPERMNAPCLAPLLRRPDASSFVKVIDVRDEASRKGGRIKGSVQITHADVVGRCATLAKDWQGLEALVFASAQSPDLDETAAIPIIQAYKQSGIKAPQVYTLMGGIVGWIDTYNQDASLVDDYDPTMWGTSRLKSAKSALKGLKVAVPEAPNQMTCSTLAVMLLEDHQDSAIVDVRPTQEGGLIPGSLHIPHDRLAAQAADFAMQWKDKNAIILLSYVSPDLDQTCAVQLMQAFQEIQSTTSVFILIGGLKTWLHRNSHNPELVQSFSPHLLNEKRPSVLDTDPHRANHTGKLWENRRLSASGVRMVIDVPEAPLQMGQVEMATMLRGSQGSPRRSIKSVIVDVRDTQEGGCIPDSVHIPGGKILDNVPKYAASWCGLSSVIFVSAVSPDLDETVATPVMHWLHEKGSEARVFVLLGGMKDWVHSYHASPLVEGFVASHWGLRPHSRCSFKDKTLELEVEVPEAPLTLSRQELALLVRRHSDSSVFVDVRASQDGGTVAGSVHVPYDELMVSSDSVAAKWADKDIIVFLSPQQGDLDVSAATPMLQALRAHKSGAKVFILIGGLCGWMNAYSTDTSLVTGYDATKWVKQW